MLLESIQGKTSFTLSKRINESRSANEVDKNIYICRYRLKSKKTQKRYYSILFDFSQTLLFLPKLPRNAKTQNTIQSSYSAVGGLVKVSTWDESQPGNYMDRMLTNVDIQNVIKHEIYFSTITNHNMLLAGESVKSNIVYVIKGEIQNLVKVSIEFFYTIKKALLRVVPLA